MTLDLGGKKLEVHNSGQFFPKKEWLPAIFAGTVSLNNIAELVTLSNIDKITVYVYNNKHYKDGD